MNWSEIEFLFFHEKGIWPSELDKLEFFRIEYLLDNWKEYNKKEKQKREKRKNEEGDNLSTKSMLRQQRGLLKKSNFSGLPTKLPKF